MQIDPITGYPYDIIQDCYINPETGFPIELKDMKRSKDDEIMSPYGNNAVLMKVGDITPEITNSLPIDKVSNLPVLPSGIKIDPNLLLPID